MRKIAIVAHGLSDGGAERVAAYLACSFSMYYNVHFVAVYNSKKEYALNDKIEYHFVGKNGKNRISNLIYRNKKIKNIIEENNIDIVISFLTNELIYTTFFKKKIFFSLRNDPKNSNNGFLDRHIRNWVYKKSTGVVFQTPGARDYFSNGIREKSTIILNPIDLKYIPKWKGNDSKDFITACRLNKQKNLEMMIRAFYDFHKSYSDYKLKIYGEGDEKEKLENLIHSIGAENYIFLCGRSNDVFGLMENSLCFLLSSDFEGLSNSMLEALAIGIPAICTDCPPGGAKMLIQDGVNGFLSEVGNSKEFTKKMEYIVCNLDKLSDVSNKEIEIKKKLSIDSITQEWIDFIEK